MGNELNFTQISAILNTVNNQVTGQTNIAPTDTREFVSVAQTLLKQGYDPIINAISQVLARTIFAVRPYSRQFGELAVSTQKYGAITRKINFLDQEAEYNDAYPYDAATDTDPLTDGESIDQWEIKKPKVVQTNFYGGTTYQRHITMFKDQLDVAFEGPEQFAEFVSGVLLNLNNQIEQDHESMARICIANLIAGVYAINETTPTNGQVIHLLTEYKEATGLADLTNVTVYQPENYGAFIKWAYARIATLTRLMGERSELFHQNINNKTIMRHTPMDRMKTFLYAPFKDSVEARVLADTYHDNYLKLATNSSVNFFQSIKSPNQISVIPTYLKRDGLLETGNAQIAINNVLGVIMDEEAAGYTTINNWSMATPMNARGGYSNTFFHYTDRYWNDFTENAVVLLLD